MAAEGSATAAKRSARAGKRSVVFQERRFVLQEGCGGQGEGSAAPGGKTPENLRARQGCGSISIHAGSADTLAIRRAQERKRSCGGNSEPEQLGVP